MSLQVIWEADVDAIRSSRDLLEEVPVTDIREREVEYVGRDSRMQGRFNTCDRRQDRKMGWKSLRLQPSTEKVSQL